MSGGQLAGLIVTVALVSAASGLWLATILVSLRADVSADRRHRACAYADWLAAWRTASRAAQSFVAAFRALGAEPADAPYHTLRQAEAQRARADWCEALRRLDQAEARLIALSDDDGIGGRLATFERPTPECLRAAINGGAGLTDRLHDRLRSDDERAVALVRCHSVTAAPNASGVRGLIRRGTDFLASILDQWSRG